MSTGEVPITVTRNPFKPPEREKEKRHMSRRTKRVLIVCTMTILVIGMQVGLAFLAINSSDPKFRTICIVACLWLQTAMTGGKFMYVVARDD